LNLSILLELDSFGLVALELELAASFGLVANSDRFFGGIAGTQSNRVGRVLAFAWR
jgi:hypothetical protein